jgi:phage baseplate assembly protein W
MSFDFAIFNNDIKIQSNGAIKTVSDNTKLRQDILKVLVTTLGSNKFHPWYGCTVGQDIIGRNLPDNRMLLDIQSSVVQSLDRLQKLQTQQMTFQKMSLAEMISSIGDVVAYRAQEDLRQVYIRVVVYTRQLTQIEETFTLNI